MDDAATTIQGSHEPKGLGTKLAPLLSGGFFRPLARPSAPLYVDCADRLEQASDDGGQLSHSDAIALIRDALVAHPSLKLDEDEGGQFGDIRQRAGQIFNRLLEAGWLEDRPASLDERWIILSPRLSPLLGLLRGYAEDDLAELKDFAATVRSVCETLLAEGALDPVRRNPEELRQVVKELFDRATRAGQQMRAVETVILRYAQQQRASLTPNETLLRFLVEFHEGEHMVCYDTLEHGGLLPKLKQARLVAQLGLDVNHLVAVNGIHHHRKVKSRRIALREAGVAIGVPLHRCANSVAVTKINIVAHTNLVPVIHDRCTGKAKQKRV